MITINKKAAEIRICLLGEFTITSGKARLSEQDGRASKIWKMLQYLIMQRHRFVPHNELIGLFCADEGVGNPANTLRTMIYRTRGILEKAGFDMVDEMILSKNGGYTWNNKMAHTVDVDEFEKLYLIANSDAKTEDEIGFLLKAIKLYRGDLLPEAAGERWVMPLGRRYRAMYIECVHKALKLLFLNDRIEEAEKLCRKALSIDPFDEKTLEYHLRSLIAQGKNSEALEEYKNMELLFYDVLNVRFSEDLRRLYSQIQRPVIDDDVPLEEILEDWLRDGDFHGAFYCDLSVFKSVCQIEARGAYRSGKSTYIVSINVDPNDSDNERISLMKQVGMVIPGSLRRGDLFTRSSPNQYMLMLHNLTHESCKALVDRIMRTLDSKKVLRIEEVSIRALTPVQPEY